MIKFAFSHINWYQTTNSHDKWYSVNSDTFDLQIKEGGARIEIHNKLEHSPYDLEIVLNKCESGKWEGTSTIPGSAFLAKITSVEPERKGEIKMIAPFLPFYELIVSIQ